MFKPPCQWRGWPESLPEAAGPGTGAWHWGLILLAQLLVIIDVSIVTLALPAIQRALHFPRWACSGCSAGTRWCSAAGWRTCWAGAGS